jgi:zinc transport system permease protein
MHDLIAFASYSFIQHAFLAGLFVAVACAALGMFLVLRKMSLIGDGLSHVSFGAIALGLFFGVYPLAVAIPLVMLGSVLILRLSERARLYGDAAIGIVSAIGIASGILLASLSGGFNVDLFSYLFGNILAIGAGEVWLSVGLSAVVLLSLVLLYWDLFSMTFDEEYAAVSGVHTKMINTLLALLTAITVVLSIKVVGVMLVSALLILPPVAALQAGKRFSRAMALSIAFAVASVFVGILCSFFLDLPAGATIVMLLAGCFAGASWYRFRHSR